jgi:hypothetical protein
MERSDTVRRKRDLVAGMVFLFVMIAIWESSAIIIKTIFAPDKKVPFKNPLFLTYFSSCFFILYLIPLAIKWFWLKR